MTGAAVRSRLLLLRRERGAARRGHDLLEQKREVLLRELLRRTRLRADVADRAAAALADARARLRQAQTELGRLAVESAALAQTEMASVERRAKKLLGIALPALHGRFKPFRPCYGPGGTAESLDRAGSAFADALPVLVRLAEEDLAVRNLQEGFAKTVRRLNALEKVVLPRLDDEIRGVTTALEEEDRDEALRRKRWLAASGRDSRL
jgi:V/A-type H+/Na+-transporting ATPase subunit D